MVPEFCQMLQNFRDEGKSIFPLSLPGTLDKFLTILCSLFFLFRLCICILQKVGCGSLYNFQRKVLSLLRSLSASYCHPSFGGFVSAVNKVVTWL